MTRFDEALDLLDLEDWLMQYTETKSAGNGEVRVSPCPECGNEKYKLYVNVVKKRWICYVCDYGRGLADVTRLMSAVSGRTRFAVRLELSRMVVPAPAGDITDALKNAFDAEVDTDEVYDAEEIELPGDTNFLGGITSRKALTYAWNRGIGPELVRTLGLRFASELFIKKRSSDPVRIKGPFLVFPVTIAGRPVSYQGRRIVDKDPKYVSASNVKDWLWPLGPELFNVYDGGRLFLVEGVFDALGLLAMGHGAVCTFGKNISDRQLEILTELNPTSVVFAWDLDAKTDVARAVDRVAYRFRNTGVVSFDGHPSGRKVDPGNTLTDPEAARWMQSRLNEVIDARSPTFFQWRMT